MTTLWGLPPAQLTSNKNYSAGTRTVQGEIRWLSKNHLRYPVIGLALGIAIAFGLAKIIPITLVAWAALTMLGVSIGLLLETSIASKANLRVGADIQTALQQLASDEADARSELIEYSRRQRQWTQMLEEQIQERTQTMQGVVNRIQKLREERVTSLRGFSHDLRNPLAVLKSNAEYLKDYAADIPEGKEVLDDMVDATGKMEQMLKELMGAASSETAMVQLTPERLDVAPLADRLQRRMRALVHGKDIRVSVMRTREAPESIITDPLLLDRVLDNLLTNAAKYTNNGSIVIEVAGNPQFLTIKVSDTGRGIPENKIEQIFEPGGSDKNERAKNSFGVGLSVVVKLLSQLGGKLDVMSKEGEGTTFWAHFPLKLPELRLSDTPEAKDVVEIVPNVVNIRHSSP
ncbi:MAG: HAMP domain-containing histidine kinase [Myxococcales bacterium]|nr:MAG: HAMP domain-containing histidine kinase [Myxococcales bacterium]